VTDYVFPFIRLQIGIVESIES